MGAALVAIGRRKPEKGLVDPRPSRRRIVCLNRDREDRPCGPGSQRPAVAVAPARPPRDRLHAESLEPRQVMAVSVLGSLPDVVVPVTAGDQAVPLAGRYDDTAVGGTVVRFDINTAAPLDKVYARALRRRRAGPQPRHADHGRELSEICRWRPLCQHDDPSIGAGVHRPSGAASTWPASGSLQIGKTLHDLRSDRQRARSRAGSTECPVSTIAMAKLGRLPNRPSNQPFFNLADNTDPLESQQPRQPKRRLHDVRPRPRQRHECDRRDRRGL